MNPPSIKEEALADLLESLSQLYRSAASDGRLNIVNESARDLIRMDAEAMRQVFINLIKNALESGSDSSVTLTVADEPHAVCFRVEDDGPGFTDDILTRGFEPYVSTKKDGSGLGLVISQRIVYDHGGQITLGNRPEGGAVITITLPVEHG